MYLRINELFLRSLPASTGQDYPLFPRRRGFFARSFLFLTRADRTQDIRIAGTTAEIAGEIFTDLFVRRI